MQDYWVVIIAVLCAVALLIILFLGLCLYIRMSRKKMKSKVVLRQQPSRVHPHIPGPIYSITGSSPTGSIEKEPIKPMDAFGTTRKLSMMFDSRKRGSSTFSRASQCQSYFENSPAPKHKEYLDFNDIEKILPSLQKQPHSQRPPPTRISIIEERPFAGHELEPVREVFAENHMSFRRERQPAVHG